VASGCVGSRFRAPASPADLPADDAEAAANAAASDAASTTGADAATVCPYRRLRASRRGSGRPPRVPQRSANGLFQIRRRVFGASGVGRFFFAFARAPSLVFRIGSGRHGLPPRARRSRLARDARGVRAVAGTRAPLLRVRLLQRHRERLVRVEAMDVSRTRSTVLRALGRNDGTETARSRGARTGGRLGRLARRRRVERVTHHLQQLIVVVLRHRARPCLHTRTRAFRSES
jgi:hypothetical protein